MQLLTHPTRRTRPSGTDMYGIYRNMVLFDFKSEIHSGFFVAYYRNFAIPSTARTLAATGEMKSRPMKRSYDTGIVLHEIIANGFEHERSQAMINLLRRVHKGVPGTPDDFVYVLMTLLVLPLRWTERHGWRRLTELEKRAATDFYAELGRQMGLEGIPATFAEADSISFAVSTSDTGAPSLLTGYGDACSAPRKLSPLYFCSLSLTYRFPSTFVIVAWACWAP